jgi:hypothetical protein
MEFFKGQYVTTANDCHRRGRYYMIFIDRVNRLTHVSAFFNEDPIGILRIALEPRSTVDLDRHHV